MIITEETVAPSCLLPLCIVLPFRYGPCMHEDIEEVILILEGEGEAWVDGETAKFKKGDAVFFPANSRHQVRNTGDTMLVTASIFSAPTNPDSYLIYDEDVFAD